MTDPSPLVLSSSIWTAVKPKQLSELLATTAPGSGTMDRNFDPSSERLSMKLDFGGGSTQVPTPTGPVPHEHQIKHAISPLESPSFMLLLNQLRNEGSSAADILQKNAFKAPQYKAVQQLPTPTPTSLLFPDQPPSSDQLQYAQGFLDALKTVQQANNFKPLLLNSPSVLDQFKPLVNCLSPQASPVNQPMRSATSDFEAILNAMKQREKEPEPSRDNGASTSSPPRQPPPQQQQPQPQQVPTNTAAASAAAAAAAAAAAHRLQPPPPMPFFNAAASAASSVAPPSVGPSENSLNDSEDDSDSDSDSRSKNAGSAPPRSRSTIKKDISGMDDQDAKKLERKRLRNRQAATKCRQKKLARISELEQQVNQEREHAKQLDYNLDVLRKQVRNLEQAISVHAGSGCQLH